MAPITLNKGQETKLSTLTSFKELDVHIKCACRHRIVIGCMCLNEQKRLIDSRYVIFYGQNSSPQKDIGNNSLSVTRDDENFYVDLRKLSSEIKHIIFSISIQKENHTLASITSASFSINDCEKELACYSFDASLFESEKSVIVADLFVKNKKWFVSVPVEGKKGNFAQLLQEYGCDPNAILALQEASFRANQSITLYRTGQANYIDLRNLEKMEPLQFNLNWRHTVVRPGLLWMRKKSSVDLDLGCMYELKNGSKDVIQALGGNFGSRDSSPYIYLDKDDRDGSSDDGENLYICRLDLIKRVIVFAYQYKGDATFSQMAAMATISHQNGNKTIVPINTNTDSKSLCVICEVVNDNNVIKIIKEERYFKSQRFADSYYKFGFMWKQGFKS
ncbi:TerD family protein [bacterium]|nr:TerD family protein [bacterium]